MKRFSALLACLALIIGFSLAHAAPTFILSAGEGKLLKTQDGQYTLEVNLPDFDQVLVMQDRPSRTFKYISSRELASSWKVGKNSFQADPPNAVVSSYTMRPTGVTVTSMEASKGGQTRFTLQSKHPLKQGQLRKLTLFIDGFNCVDSQGYCAQTGILRWFCSWGENACGNRD
jgi:hypothetical protein